MNKNGRTGPAWAPAENEVLRAMYASGSWDELLASLPRRTRPAIRAQANSLGLKRDGRQQWETTEIRLLYELYPTTTPIREIVARLAPHTKESIHKQAACQGLKRPRCGVEHHHPGWERLRLLLESRGALTQAQIAGALGISQSAVHKLRQAYGNNLRTAGYVPPVHQGKWTPMIGLADGRPDAPKPFRPQGARSGRKMANRFATAAGLVTPSLTAPTGRVFRQPMEIEDWRQTCEEAA
ncbi:helix-turn-helix domain-containing protein [Trinickia sp.]|uniref:helix-turn-helix domain-containing protein n=1 Tax=Trinickia sp. TaxID=2571163 RepID=UPI003F801EB5